MYTLKIYLSISAIKKKTSLLQFFLSHSYKYFNRSEKVDTLLKVKKNNKKITFTAN